MDYHAHHLARPLLLLAVCAEPLILTWYIWWDWPHSQAFQDYQLKYTLIPSPGSRRIWASTLALSQDNFSQAGGLVSLNMLIPDQSLGLGSSAHSPTWKAIPAVPFLLSRSGFSAFSGLYSPEHKTPQNIESNVWQILIIIINKIFSDMFIEKSVFKWHWHDGIHFLSP